VVDGYAQKQQQNEGKEEKVTTHQVSDGGLGCGWVVDDQRWLGKLAVLPGNVP
jgi:hypothetical protein